MLKCNELCSRSCYNYRTYLGGRGCCFGYFAKDNHFRSYLGLDRQISYHCFFGGPPLRPFVLEMMNCELCQIFPAWVTQAGSQKLSVCYPCYMLYISTRKIAGQIQAKGWLKQNGKEHEILYQRFRERHISNRIRK